MFVIIRFRNSKSFKAIYFFFEIRNFFFSRKIRSTFILLAMLLLTMKGDNSFSCLRVLGVCETWKFRVLKFSEAQKLLKVVGPSTTLSTQLCLLSKRFITPELVSVMLHNESSFFRPNSHTEKIEWSFIDTFTAYH